MNRSPATSPWRFALVIAAAFLPLLCYWACVYIAWPYRWYDCFDPEGIHFAAGLSLLRGWGPGNVDNPATPLHVIGAIIASLLHLTIFDLEQFRPVAYTTAIALRLVATGVLIRYVLRDFHWTWQVALIWIPWLAPDIALISRQWSPEALYYSFGVVAVAIIYGTMNEATNWQKAFLCGLAIGMMIGVKFLFVVWVAAAIMAIAVTNRPLIASKSCMATLIGIGLGFFLATLPAITRYPRMFQWLSGLATKSGQYGSGASGFIDFQLAARNLMEIVQHEKAWTLVVVSTVICLLIRKPRTCTSLFCVLAILGGYVLALKSFAPRYLAPTGLIVLLAAAELLRNSVLRSNRWAGTGALLFTGLLLFKTLSLDFTAHKALVADRQESERVLNAFLDDQGRTSSSVILYGWRAFTPAFTVRYISQSERNLFDSEIDAVYPCEGLLNLWPDDVRLPSDKTSWDFIVVGEEYMDTQGLMQLRRTFQNQVVGRYIVFKNVPVDTLASD